MEHFSCECSTSAINSTKRDKEAQTEQFLQYIYTLSKRLK